MGRREATYRRDERLMRLKRFGRVVWLKAAPEDSSYPNAQLRLKCAVQARLCIYTLIRWYSKTHMTSS